MPKDEFFSSTARSLFFLDFSSKIDFGVDWTVAFVGVRFWSNSLIH
jgi:hypothetical protein